MKKLFQFIKPYWPNILLTIVLLYIMANTDLRCQITSPGSSMLVSNKMVSKTQYQRFA
jgi:hypothetical protein